MKSSKQPNASVSEAPQPVVVQMTELASFSVENIPDRSDMKKITFSYSDPEPRKHPYLMLSLFTPGEGEDELPFEYNHEKQAWIKSVEKDNNAGELFYITAVEVPGRIENRDAAVLQKGFLSFKNGELQPVNRRLIDPPAMKLQHFLLTENGSIQKDENPDVYKLKTGERYITIYTPPGYESDPNKNPAYDLQIVLDGWQYLNIMQMNLVLDNLSNKKEIAPPVSVFISPNSGAPNKEFNGLVPVVPVGYSYIERQKEYCCNPQFAKMLSQLPLTVSKEFNTTQDPKHTTIWGVSAGGLQAVYTALLFPNRFGNVVAESPMAWNIPTQHITTDTTPLENGEHWRSKMTNLIDPKTGFDVSWRTSTAPLPESEGEHNEYLTEMVKLARDDISGRAIDPSGLRFYFDAGEIERSYEAVGGSANLVKATELLIQALEEKGANVIDHSVHMLMGGHHTMTWMRNQADVFRAMYPRPGLTSTLRVTEEQKESELSATSQTAKLLNVSPSQFKVSEKAVVKVVQPLSTADSEQAKPKVLNTAKEVNLTRKNYDSKS